MKKEKFKEQKLMPEKVAGKMIFKQRKGRGGIVNGIGAIRILLIALS